MNTEKENTQKIIDRRDFLIRTLVAAIGSALLSCSGKTTPDQNPPPEEPRELSIKDILELSKQQLEYLHTTFEEMDQRLKTIMKTEIEEETKELLIDCQTKKRSTALEHFTKGQNLYSELKATVDIHKAKEIYSRLTEEVEQLKAKEKKLKKECVVYDFDEALICLSFREPLKQFK